jgi:CubicO group peptidase (beta-lactamase class C family)
MSYRAAGLLLALLAPTFLPAQSGPASAAAPAAPLTDFAGVYSYRDGMTVALVPKRQELVAILDEALYKLQRIGGDEFRNGAGQSVRFIRDERGKVIGLKEAEDYFPLRTASVPADIVGLTVPRKGSETASRPPVQLSDGLKVGSAAAAGFSQRTLDGLVRSILDEKYPDVHGVLLWRKGRLVFEEYFYGFDRERPHQLRSATKSFHSVLAGIAMDLGKIRGDQQPIAELLPWPASTLANPDPRKAAITVGDLLSMRTGLACDDRDPSSPGNEQLIYSKPDWGRFTLDLPMAAAPGTVARYCSGGVHVAARLVERAVGEDLLAFARRTLFEPLGFKNYKWPYQPVQENAGTFGQLYLRPRDMLKFGVMVHDKGRWQGRQIVSQDWIERSTRERSRIGSRGYGYLWWWQTFTVASGGAGSQSREVRVLVATGNGGQKIYIVPSLELVAVFTGGTYNSPQDSPPNAIMADVILPELLGP